MDAVGGNEKWLTNQLVSLDKDLPLLDLILFFHAFHDVEAKVGANEERNLAVLRALRPSYDLGFGGFIFKPLNSSTNITITTLCRAILTRLFSHAFFRWPTGLRKMGGKTLTSSRSFTSSFC